MPGVRERVAFVAREGRIRAGGLRGEPIVDERRVVVAPAGEQRRRRGQRLRVGGLEPRRPAQQRETGVLLAVLPDGEAVVEQLPPEVVAVRRDVVGALGREPRGSGERTVRAGHIAGDHGEAAEVVPGGGVRVLFILEDRVGEEALGLSELLVARLGFLARGFQCRYRVVNLRVGRRQVAGRPGRRPPPLSREQGARGEGESQESRCGAHGGLEMAREGATVNSRKT